VRLAHSPKIQTVPIWLTFHNDKKTFSRLTIRSWETVKEGMQIAGHSVRPDDWSNEQGSALTPQGAFIQLLGNAMHAPANEMLLGMCAISVPRHDGHVR
jgi:hypothetical protein